MHPIIRKTLGGLSAQYYFRQLFFGVMIASFPFYMSYHSAFSLPINLVFYIIVNTLLYPYSRFVYESIIHFIVGDNIFIFNALIMLVVKIMTMVMCWSAAIFVAPIGLLYLYYYHSKAR